MVHVQAILFASLAASLFSAFLAMLGKRWLNRYESTEVRGSAIERSRNRQRKLDGITAWYFDSVMESLSLMLQVALLLLGCALSRYLWGIDTAVALVVLGITSLGVILFLFIVIAGATTESCPYQTPGSQLLRSLGRIFWNTLVVVTSTIGKAFAETIRTIGARANYYHPWWSKGNIVRFSQDLVSELPRAFAADAHCLWRAILQGLTAIPTRTYRLLRVHNRLRGISPTPEQRSTWQTAILNLRCISWTLQTSLDPTVRASAMIHLMSVLELADLDFTLVMDCFNIFVGCVRVNNQRVVVTPGLDQLATLSAGCFSRIFHRLSTMDSTSSVLVDLRRRYHKVLPFRPDFTGIRSPYALTMTHAVVTGDWDYCSIVWNDDRPSDLEHIMIAQVIAEVAQAGYQETRGRGVHRMILWFAMNSLSLDPPPSASVVADCLKIIAADLCCDLPNVTILGRRCICLILVGINILTQNQCTSGASL